MRKLFLTAALVAGSLTLAANTTPVFAQGAEGGAAGGAAGAGAGAGGGVSTPSKSVPRVGPQNRDDSMAAGQRKPMKQVRNKKPRKKNARM